ncbi:MAG: LysM peptidoglycan-binding domain-containing protein [Candidatus Omnitrophota bacterium]
MKTHNAQCTTQYAVLLLGLSFIFSGCIVRTYPLTRDRIDQDLSGGNRGYLQGKAPAAGERSTTRTTQVVEVEIGSPVKFEKAPNPKPTEAAMPLPVEKGTAEGNRGYIAESVSPEINEPSVQESAGFQSYKVEKNDTLQKISQKYYGTTKQWNKIYEANKDILKGPNKLYVGQSLKIPVMPQMKKTLKEPAGKLK